MYNFWPLLKKPITLIVIAGSITSSIRYNSLKLGNAIATRIKAGVIVHISSINVKKKSIYMLNWTISLFHWNISPVVSEGYSNKIINKVPC